jgi:hypothetical protein
MVVRLLYPSGMAYAYLASIAPETPLVPCRWGRRKGNAMLGLDVAEIIYVQLIPFPSLRSFITCSSYPQDRLSTLSKLVFQSQIAIALSRHLPPFN